MLLKAIARLMAPPLCCGCGREGLLLCKPCMDAAAQSYIPRCYRCNKYDADGRTCSACMAESSLAGLVCGGSYDGSVRQLVRRLKFGHLREAADTLAALTAPKLPSNLNAITYVPIVARRHHQRGYNQAELIARSLARQTALPCRPLLFRLKDIQQVGMDRKQRLLQAQGMFGARGSPAGARLLVVDDVMTTGATLQEAAVTLRLAGARQVWAAVAARD